MKCKDFSPENEGRDLDAYCVIFSYALKAQSENITVYAGSAIEAINVAISVAKEQGKQYVQVIGLMML